MTQDEQFLKALDIVPYDTEQEQKEAAARLENERATGPICQGCVAAADRIKKLHQRMAFRSALTGLCIIFLLGILLAWLGK